MARYKVILTYDGSRYHGFQRQTNSATIQGAVESTLRKLGWDGQSILSAGRTDAGVHAFGQVIAFDLDWNHSAEQLQAAINSLLPNSIAAQSVVEADAGFHPRYDARRRSYRYHIFCQNTRSPVRENYAWRVWPAVDLESMARAAGQLVGLHDFAAFGTPPRAGGSTWRTVYHASWNSVENHWDSPDLVFEITGDAFLFRMVRRLVYIQAAVGQGKLDAKVIQHSLENPPEAQLQGLAPPNGLFLMAVSYGDEKNLGI